MPLETAEQFLLTLGSISNLEARLKLWTFKLDFKVRVKPCNWFWIPYLILSSISNFEIISDFEFNIPFLIEYLINWKVMEKDICEPYRALKDGLKAVRNSEVKIMVAQKLFQTFRYLLSVTLAMGNILNRSNATAFRIEVLEKLSGVRDTVNRKSLLHHVVSRCTRSSLIGELIFLTWFWEGAWSCSPTLATCCWSWRTSAWSPALTMRSFWPTSAEWRCFSHLLNYFHKQYFLNYFHKQ